jgi:hypothetical protein
LPFQLHSVTFRYLGSYFSPNSAKSQLQVRNEPNSVQMQRSAGMEQQGERARSAGMEQQVPAAVFPLASSSGQRTSLGWSSRSRRLSPLSPPALGRGPRGEDGAAGPGGRGGRGGWAGRGPRVGWSSWLRTWWVGGGRLRAWWVGGGRLRAGDRSLLPSRVAVEWSGDFFAVGPTCKTREIRRRRRPGGFLSKGK